MTTPEESSKHELMPSSTVRSSASILDQFAASVRGFFDSAANNVRAVVVGLVVLLGIGVGMGYYLSGREQRSEAAAGALYLARQAIQTELKTIAQAEAPKKAEPKKPVGKTLGKEPPAPEANADLVAFKKLDVDGRLGTGVQKLKAVAQDFAGTRSGFEARLALGDLYYNHGEPAKAVSWYREASEAAPGNFDRSLALYSLGYALENSKQPEEAGKAYEKALGLGESALKGDLLLGLARTYELRKDQAQAKATYDRILSQLPNTEYAKSAETFKTQLSGN